MLAVQLPAIIDGHEERPVIAIHLPPADFVPPEPEQWGDYPDLSAACGRYLGDVIAGYGPLDVVQLSEGLGQLIVAYCVACFPMGPPR